MKNSKSYSYVLESTDSKVLEAYLRLSKGGDLVRSEEVIKYIMQSGFKRQDARLEKVFEVLESNDYLTLSRFRELVNENELVEKIFKNDLPIKDFKIFSDLIQEIYTVLLKDESGSVATYIPPLAKADPRCLGISFCSVVGQRLDVGHAAVKFSVQSVSKPVTYALAVTEHGTDRVHEGVGFEPSGRHFNERLLKEPEQIPHNPLINAGSIYCSSLLGQDTSSWERVEKMLDTWRDLTDEGDPPHIDTAVFLGEQATANRNNCLAYMMAEQGLLDDVHNALTTYFQACSITSNAKNLSLLTATLANSGSHPITNARVFPPGVTAQMLTLMLTCGLYDGSGEFLVRCGFPAKSGVSGIVVGVLPGIGGFCVYSPRLDANGNSVRGIKFCELLAKKLPAVHSFSCKTLADGSIENILRDPFAWRTAADRGALQTVTLRELASLWWSAAWNDETRIRQLAARGMDVNGVDYDGRSALHIAASNGNISMYSLLLSLGADPRARDRRGVTPSGLISKLLPDGSINSPSCPISGTGVFSLNRYFAESSVDPRRVLAELEAYGLPVSTGLEADVERIVQIGATADDKSSLVVKALCGKLQVPNWRWFASRLELLSAEHPGVTWAISTSTGQCLSGRAKREIKFPVAGLVRPVLYCATAAACGLEEVQRWVGEEPSGEREDALRLLSKSNRPYNAFVMTGVLTLCGLLLRRCGDVKNAVQSVRDLWQKLAGSDATEVDDDGHEDHRVSAKVRCVAYLLKSENTLPSDFDIEEVIEVFTRLHSFQVSSCEVAAVGAALSRGGDEVIPAETNRQTLSLMFSCGADHMSGEWAFKIGVPAKVDVAHGRALIVVPKILGMCVSGGKISEVVEFMKAVELNFSFHLFKRNDLVTGNSLADPTLYYGSIKHELVSRLLFTAAKGDLQTLKTILAIPGFDCNWPDYDQRTALHLAAANGHLSVVQCLLAAGARADVRDRWGVSPLEEAQEEGNDDVVDALRNVALC